MPLQCNIILYKFCNVWERIFSIEQKGGKINKNNSAGFMNIGTGRQKIDQKIGEASLRSGFLK
jgi:hypothetical protein